MSRLYVTGPVQGVAQRGMLRRIEERIRSDGHAVASAEQAGSVEGPVDAVRECDAVVAILDGAQPDARSAAALALAHALEKPTLALRGAGQAPLPPFVAGLLTEVCEADSEEELLAALSGFYPKVQPFAGRLVRDLIPRLVKEAGHDLRFRELTAEERPRFLKRKIVEEAKALERADLAGEREEVADLLEALETLLQVRGHDRNTLKQVKDAKNKRRGGFEKCFVVEESANDPGQDAPPADDASLEEAPPGDVVEEPLPHPSAHDLNAPGKARGEGEGKVRSPEPQFFEV